MGFAVGPGAHAYNVLLDLIFHNVAKRYSRETSEKDHNDVLSPISADDREKPSSQLAIKV